jgi:type III secretion protein V
MIDLKALQQGMLADGTAAPRRASLAGRFGDVALAGLALIVIALMVLPMPLWALDTLISLNIALGILLMLFALYVPTPLAFSTFPTVLLFTTMFRVSLNVATTRQILLNGHAGDIIDTFGNHVIAGSLLVGLVVFFIITIVQFIVIAKGAERVAEVGARFTLDAMPGKQLAIDSDLRAGLISQAEAIRQRDKLSAESQFFGAMDGAMKFVKGDAIAGIVIVFVNLLGGMAMGMLVLDMSAADAVHKYSVLSIGDGLVTQIPALFISMAAGIVVTRTSGGEGSQHLAEQIGMQFAMQPRALLVAGAVIALFAAVPGFPAIPFLAIGGFCAYAGFRQGKHLVEQVQSTALRQIPNAGREGDALPVNVEDAQTAPFAVLAIEIPADALAKLSLGDLSSELGILRERLRSTLGIPFPGVSIRRARKGTRSGPTLLLMETPVAAVDIASAPNPKAAARRIVMALYQLVQRHAKDLIGVQETKWLLTQTEKKYPDLVREALGMIGLPPMANLLAALVSEGVPLRDMRTILETVVDHGMSQLPQPAMVDKVREACSRSLCNALVGPAGLLNVMPLAAEAEQALRSRALPPTQDGVVQFPFELVERLADRVRALLPPENTSSPAARPVVLCASDVRAGLQRQLRAFLPEVVVLAHTEVSTSVQVRAIGAVSLDEPPKFGPGPLSLPAGATA